MFGIDITQFVFVYVLPSVFTIVLMAFLYVFARMSPSTRTLLKNDLGMLKKKEWALKADSDNVCSIQTYDYESPGMLVKKKKKKASERYFFGIPMDANMNPEENKRNMRIEKHILTPYILNGKPLHLVHSAVGIVTNPTLLTALTNHGYIEDATPDEVNAVILEPKEENKIKALLPFNLDVITKYFPKHWPDVILENLDWTGYTRGVKETKGESKDLIKMMIIGAVVACAMIAGVAIASRMFG